MIKYILAFLFVVPVVLAGYTDIPTGTNTPNLGLEWMTSHTSAWRVAGGCLARNYNVAPGGCTGATDFEGTVPNVYNPYYGQPKVKEMICSSWTELTLTSTWTLRLAYRGGAVDPDPIYYMTGSMVFDNTYERGQTLRLVINDRPTVADGSFMIIITAMTQNGADTDEMRINCVVN